MLFPRHRGNRNGGGGFSSEPPATDTTPDAFSFTDVTDADLATVYESNTLTVAGINNSAVVTITGGQYSKNGGAYTSSPGTADNGDTFKVRATSSASNSTAVNVVLTIGGVSDTYTVTTEDPTLATTAPVLSWESAPSVNPPLLVVVFPESTEAGDHIVIEISDDGGDTYTEYLDVVVDNPDAPEQDETAAELADADYKLRARMERGAQVSDWSVVVNITIDAVVEEEPPSALLQFIDSAVVAEVSPTTTFPIDIGTADANRKVLLVGLLPNSYNAGSFSALSINGVACTAPNGGDVEIFVGSAGSHSSFRSQIIFAWADVPTGDGEQDVVITGNVEGPGVNMYWACYTFDKTLVADAAPTTDDTNVVDVTTCTVGLNTSAGGFVVAAMSYNIIGSNNATSASATSSTEAVVEDVAFTGSGAMRAGPIVSKKEDVGAATPFSVTFDWTGATQALGAILYWK